MMHKNGLSVDIEEVAGIVDRRCTVLGNLDAVSVLQDGTEQQLRDEIARQFTAGRTNGGRFIMSSGSPVTPATPVNKVRLYCNFTREPGVHKNTLNIY